MYALIEVRSGGLFIRPPNEKTKYGKFNFIKVKDKKNKEILFLELIRLSSIEGMISYLLGEKKPINQIEDQDRRNIVEKQLSIKVIDKIYNINDDYYSCGKIQFMTERRDLVYNGKNLVPIRNIDLSYYGWGQVNEFIYFFKNELIKVTKKNTIGEIYNILKNEYLIFGKEFFSLKKELNNIKINNDLRFFDKIDISKDDYIVKPKKCSKNSEKLIDKINKKITNIINLKIEKKIPNDWSFNEAPFYPKYVQLIKEIKKSIDESKLDLSKLKFNKLSCFDSSLMQSRQWLKDELVPRVISAPAYVLNLNFDIYIIDLTESELKRLINGPRIAYWGEGGTAFLKIIDDTPPAEAYELNKKIVCKYSIIEKEIDNKKYWYKI